MSLSTIAKGLFLTSLLTLSSLGQASYIASSKAECGIGSDGTAHGTWSAINTCNYSPVSKIKASAHLASGSVSIGDPSISIGQNGGILKARSSLRIDNINNVYVDVFGARAALRYSDILTFTSSELTDNADFVVRISAQMTGNHVIHSGNFNYPLSSTGELRIMIGGGAGSATNVEQTQGTSWVTPFRTFDINVRNGQALDLTMTLETSATIAGLGYMSGTASVLTDFSNTAGITGFEYFDLNGNPLSGDFSSRDGLAMYNASVVPVPAAAWLFGSGLIGLTGLARRKKA